MSDPKNQDSVSQWINKIRDGESIGAEKVWERYFDSLAKYANSRMSDGRFRMVDAEDVALSAMNDLFHGLGNGKFPELKNRDDFWRLLICVTKRKIANQASYQNRQKRSDSDPSGDPENFSHKSDAADPRIDVDPAWRIEFADTCRVLFSSLPNDQLREIASLMLDGFKPAEIAERLKVVPRTVERKLALIRSTWQRKLENLDHSR